MHAVAEVLLLVGLLAAMGASFFGHYIAWRHLRRDQREQWRRLGPAARRRALLTLLLMFSAVGGLFALVLVAPWGLRRTLLYLIIALGVLVIPAWLLGTVRSARREIRRSNTRR